MKPLPSTVAQELSFGEFRLDLPGRRLLRRGLAVEQLQPKVFDLLVYLAQRMDRVVSKDELAAEVWGGAAVGDEVIARAVMKLRRALGEDARAPQHLRTHAGVGYGLMSPLPAGGQKAGSGLALFCDEAAEAPTESAESESQQRWLILPTIDRNDRPDMTWAVSGIPQVLAHLLQLSSPRLHVECEDPTSELGNDRGDGLGRVLRALSETCPRWVCATEFCETADGYYLELSWGRTTEGVLTASLAGEDLLALVRTLAEHLTQAEGWSRRLMAEHAQTYAVLVEAMAQRLPGAQERTAQTLEACFNALPDWPELSLLCAEEMAKLNCYDQARAAALKAMAQCESNPELQGLHGYHALRRLSEAMSGLGRMTEMRPLLEQTLCTESAVQVDPADFKHLGRLWSLLGFIYEECTEFERARQAFVQAVSFNRRAGQTEQELWSRCRMAQVEILMGRLYSANEQLRRVLSAASAQGLKTVALTASNNLFLVEFSLGSYRAALVLAERALALSFGSHATYWANASHRLVGVLIYLNQLDRANEILRMRERRQFESLIVLATTDIMRGRWAWRLGNLAESRRYFEAALRTLEGGQLPKFRCLTALELVSLLCLMDQPVQAKALMDQQPLGNEEPLAEGGQAQHGQQMAASAPASKTPRLNLPVARNCTLADMAMARGERLRAKSLLTEVLGHVNLGVAESLRLLLSLAWLHVEDGELDAAEDLLTRLSNLDKDFPPLQWLLLALKAGYGQAHPIDWNALRAKTPAMLRQCPWVGTPQDVQQRVMGQPRPLPILLWWATW